MFPNLVTLLVTKHSIYHEPNHLDDLCASRLKAVINAKVGSVKELEKSSRRDLDSGQAFAVGS